MTSTQASRIQHHNGGNENKVFVLIIRLYQALLHAAECQEINLRKTLYAFHARVFHSSVTSLTSLSAPRTLFSIRCYTSARNLGSVNPKHGKLTPQSERADSIRYLGKMQVQLVWRLTSRAPLLVSARCFRDGAGLTFVSRERTVTRWSQERPLDLIAQLRGQVIMVCDGACKNADLTLTIWHRLWIVWLRFGVYKIHVLNIVIQQSRNKVFVIGNNLILTRTIDQKSQDRAGWHWFDLIWHLEPLPSTKSNMRHQTYLNVTLWRVRSIQSIDRLTLT